MALTITEGTKQSTMDIINARMGFPAGTIKYARIDTEWKTRDNYPGGSFTAGLALFIEEAPESEKLSTLHHEFGCTLPQSAIDEMATTDDRQVLYKHLEYIINFQDAQERQRSEQEFDIVAEQATLDALKDELGIETLFSLTP